MHKVMSPISSCITSRGSSAQPRGLAPLINRAMCHIAAMGLLLSAMMAAAVPACAQSASIEQTFAGSLTPGPGEPLAVSGSFYVPAYSSVAMSQGKLRADFSVTLSVHNASETRPLVLKRIAYFDTTGKLVESYLKSSIAIKPFSTVEIFIATSDTRGGTGANFVVDW